jgi:hypothetical protein
MNIRPLVAILALSMLAGTSLAAEYTNFPLEPSIASRAEVRAEFEMARAAGELADVSAEYGAFTFDEIASTRTRVEASAVRQASMMAGKSSARHNTGNYVGG